MSVTIERLGAGDWGLWRSVRLQALADSPEAFGSTLAEWADASEDRWRARMQDVPLNLIARLDHDAVGQVSALLDAGTATAELISMWVGPTARGQGVGDALIDAVTAWSAREAAT